MFEARLLDGAIFKQIVEAIRDLVTDANMDVSEEDLVIQCMDSSHVSLVDVQLQVGAFDHYRCDKPLSLGINPPNLAKVLKMMNKDDIVVLKADDDGDTLTMMFESDKDNRTIADFEIKLSDIETEQMGIPETPYQCVVRMPSTEFQRIIRDLGMMGDSCTISCTKEGVRFSVSGQIATANLLVRANSAPEKEEDQVVIAMEEPVELIFALRYLNFFTKATPLSKTVVLSMSPDVPIMIEYPIGDAGHVKYFLAPKIEDDGDEGQQ